MQFFILIFIYEYIYIYIYIHTFSIGRCRDLLIFCFAKHIYLLHSIRIPIIISHIALLFFFTLNVIFSLFNRLRDPTVIHHLLNGPMTSNGVQPVFHLDMIVSRLMKMQILIHGMITTFAKKKELIQLDLYGL